MEIINEGKSFTLSLEFYDEYDNEITPDSAKYSIYDVSSGEYIVEETSFTPTSYQHELDITSVNNRIENENNRTEKRLITIHWTYDEGRCEGVEQIKYRVKNLRGIVL